MTDKQMREVTSVSAYFHWARTTEASSACDPQRSCYKGPVYGTSFSAPQVAALAALLFSKYRQRIPPNAVREHLIRCTKGRNYSVLSADLRDAVGRVTKVRIPAPVDFDRALRSNVRGVAEPR